MCLLGKARRHHSPAYVTVARARAEARTPCSVNPLLVTDAMPGSEDHNRMRWASRRGLLELDLLLGPFVETEFPELDPSLRDDYRELMACDDQDILNWVMNRAIPTKPRLTAIVAKIRDHNAAKLNR